MKPAQIMLFPMTGSHPMNPGNVLAGSGSRLKGNQVTARSPVAAKLASADVTWPSK